MANHNLPTLTSTYANFVTEMDARMDDISIGFDPALTTVTNQANGTIRWVAASNKWEKWTTSTSSWADLSSSYAINISGSAARIGTANWTVEQSGTDLLFKFANVTVIRLASTGAITSVNNITAYGTL